MPSGNNRGKMGPKRQQDSGAEKRKKRQEEAGASLAGMLISCTCIRTNGEVANLQGKTHRGAVFWTIVVKVANVQTSSQTEPKQDPIPPNPLVNQGATPLIICSHFPSVPWKWSTNSS